MGNTLNDTENREAPRIGLAPADGSGHPNAGRRRMLLRAGAIVPSVLTLSSGASAAVASNLRCWAATSAATPTNFTTADDEFFRSLVYKGKNNSQYVYCIMNPQSGCIVNGTTNAATGSTWIKADGVTKITAGTGTATVNQLSQSVYGLVFVSSDGKYVTLDPTVPGYHSVYDSCATSIGAVAIKSLLG